MVELHLEDGGKRVAIAQGKVSGRSQSGGWKWKTRGASGAPQSRSRKSGTSSPASAPAVFLGPMSYGGVCNYQVAICNQLQREWSRDPVNWAQKECSCDPTGTGDPNLKEHLRSHPLRSTPLLRTDTRTASCMELHKPGS